MYIHVYIYIYIYISHITCYQRLHCINTSLSISLSLNIYIYICIYLSTHIYIYIFLQRPRAPFSRRRRGGRRGARAPSGLRSARVTCNIKVPMYIYIYIYVYLNMYIYIYIYIYVVNGGLRRALCVLRWQSRAMRCLPRNLGAS